MFADLEHENKENIVDNVSNLSELIDDLDDKQQDVDVFEQDDDDPAPVEPGIGLQHSLSQLYRQKARQTFVFNLMVVGQAGMGKATLVNSLFRSKIIPKDQLTSINMNEKVVIDKTTVILQERKTDLQLTVINARGFGDHINNEGCWTKIVDYIEDQNRLYMLRQMEGNDRNIDDTRVHCCLYFITGRKSLTMLDIETMKHLHDKVNLIPIISLADSYTAEELDKLKASVLRELELNAIQIFGFPVEYQGENADLIRHYRKRIPFAIVASENTRVDDEGDLRWVRQYFRAMVDCEDHNQSDFSALRNLLIRLCLFDLIDATNLIFEQFRTKQLTLDTVKKEEEEHFDN